MRFTDHLCFNSGFFFRSTLILLATFTLTACNGQSEAGSATSEPKIPVASDANGAPNSSSAVTDLKPVSLDANALSMVVYKSPTCGCCTEWVTYMEKAGFKAEVIHQDDVRPTKEGLGLTDPGLMSCHTAVIDGYIVEGHVPVSDIQRLLAERPTGITGLTAPGMPMMSPGMASEIPKDYDVLAFDKNNRTRVYSSY